MCDGSMSHLPSLSTASWPTSTRSLQLAGHPPPAPQIVDATKAATSSDGQMTQPRIRRAHRVHPAIMSTAVPDAATHCPTFSTTFSISGCTRGGCTRNLFPDITCSNRAGGPQTDRWQLSDVRCPQDCASIQDQCLPRQRGTLPDPDNTRAGLMPKVAPYKGASCRAHLLNPVKLVEPGGVVSGGQAALALKALMTVHQPGLQLLALRAEANLQGSSIPTSVPIPCQTHPMKGPIPGPSKCRHPSHCWALILQPNSTQLPA